VNYAQTPRSQSIAFFREALVQMGKQTASFHPRTYAVWYEHVAGLNEALSMALQARLNSKVPISDEEIAQLYQSHIEARQARSALGVSHVLRSIMHEVMDSARAAGADLSRFTESLDRRAKELSAPLEQFALEALVSGLIGDTQQMRVATLRVGERIDSHAREFTQLQVRLKEAEGLAATDALTGLNNRRGFDASACAIQLEAGSFAGAALLFIDIDRFKEINDRYGHVLGDKVLCAVADVIRASVKGRDIAARLGGEEFAVLLPATSLQGALALAQQLREALEKGRVRRQQGPPIATVTMSVGVAYGRAEDSLETLIARADASMYAAKQAGRNRVFSADTI